jgi:hypothetical protein
VGLDIFSGCVHVYLLKTFSTAKSRSFPRIKSGAKGEF